MIFHSRGSSLLRFFDQIIGRIILFFLFILVCLIRRNNRCRDHITKEKCVAFCCYGAIGDALLIQEVVKNWKKNNPHTRIILFSTISNKSASNLNSFIYDKCYQIDLKKMNPLSKIVRDEHIDLIVDCNQWVNISAIHCLIAEINNPSIRIKGFSRSYKIFRNYYIENVEHSDKIHELLNYANLICNKDYSSNSFLKDIVPRLFDKKEFDIKHRTVLIHMWPSGTRSYLKEWPEKYWLELCERLMADGYQLYFSGSFNDKNRSFEFVSKLSSKKFRDISGEFKLHELAEFIRNEIDICISVNTGIMHLAYLQNIPVIGLHGPTNPMRWGPIGSSSISLLPDKGNFSYLNYGFEYPKSDKDAYAMNFLSVEKVYLNFNKLVGKF